MRKLFAISPKFKSVFTLENGRMVKGLIDEPSTRQSSTYIFLNPQRIFTVSPKTQVVAGDIILTVTGMRYLLLQSGEDFISNKHTATIFRLVQMTDNLEWQQTVMETDLLTGLQRNSSEATQGLIWCNVEPLRDQFDNALRARDQRFTIVTNAKVNDGDTLGTMKVDKVTNLLGVQVMEAQ